MNEIDRPASQERAASRSASVHRHELHNRRDFRLIYLVTLSLVLTWLPLMRLLTIWRPRGARPRLSIIEQARAEASIIASYALAGV